MHVPVRRHSLAPAAGAVALAALAAFAVQWDWLGHEAVTEGEPPAVRLNAVTELLSEPDAPFTTAHEDTLPACSTG